MRRPRVQPVVWQPPKIDRRSLPRKNTLPELNVVQVNGMGTEDVVVDKGNVFTGVEDGRILRLTADGRRLDTIADTGGRPLGIEVHPDGRLLVCDAQRGLLLVDRRSGAVEVLVESGPDLRVCNNAAVASDGTVYFTDSSSRFDLEFYRADIIEHGGTGRLLRRDPNGKIETLLAGLNFSNGVALATDESYVVVAQTGSYTLDRISLESGQHEVLVASLPAFPDNISLGSDGLIWVAMASPRVAALDIVHRLHPAVRKAVWALPDRLQPHEKRVVWTRAIDGITGETVHDFYGVHPEFHMVTGVREAASRVYLSSLNERAIAWFDLTKP